MKDVLEELKKEHRRIRASVDALERLLEDGCEDKLAFLREINRQFRALSDRLAKHFQYEESIGKFDEIIEDFPRFTTDVEALLQEHKEIVEEAAAVAKKTTALEADVSQRLRDVSREFRDLHRKIDNHERKETDLVQNAFFTDISESD